MKLPVYMDNHATTPVDPRVLEAMLPYFTEVYGNAASRNHRLGWEAEAAVETARKQVAKLINASPQEIVFTSGATESDNLAIKGAAWAHRGRGNHIVTLPTEHKAVLDAAKRLEQEGFSVTCARVGADGLVDPDDVKRALTDGTMLVSVMAANNEIGVLQPIAEIGKLCRERGILFHTDAAQAAGKAPVDVERMGVDLLSISAHKIYGPKGVGALYVRGKNPAVEIAPLIDGGGHERGLRSGTLNVPGIVGLGKACELCRLEMPEESRRLGGWRDRLRDGIFSRLDDVRVNGSMEHRLPHNLNVSFGGIDGESLLVGMNDVAVSLGSACMSATREPSYVLKALGVSDDRAQSSVRFGLGRFNTEEEVDYVIGRVVETANVLRDISVKAERKAKCKG
ncbi:MAG: IscS subfamily cysteine desulfurase [Acidobacteria bacterium]|nr:MAG: IscS subfamily cysteine desulfurase [Acidobacteriota bacterium]